MTIYRELNIITDPNFFQYTTKKEIELMNTSELTICLALIRKEQRRLKEKCYIRGKIKKSNADEIDFKNLNEVTKKREEIETNLVQKQGFIPTTITNKMIETLIKNNKKTLNSQKKKNVK